MPVAIRKTTKPDFQKLAHDDESPRRPQNPDPAEELRLRLEERHGAGNATFKGTAKVVRRILGEALTDEFLKFEEARTTPAKVQGGGHYVQLAKDFMGELKAERARIIEAANAANDTQTFKKPTCCNDGITPRGFCSCKVGQLAAAVAKAHEAPPRPAP